MLRDALRVEYYAGRERTGDPVHVEETARGLFTFIGPVGNGVPDEFSLKVSGTVVAPESGEWTFTLVQVGPGQALDRRRGRRRQLEPERAQRRVHGLRQRGSGGDDRAERRARRTRSRWSSSRRAVSAGSRSDADRPSPPDLMDRAVALARRADAVVCVVGTDNDWETEGVDRDSMALPPPQDELIRAVAAVNPATVVVVNAASPIAMPWADDVAAILQAWFPGEEWGNALADVLSGDISPSGKLPTTIPVRLEDTPAFTNYPGERGQVRYGEGVFVGYRWYDTRRIEPRFCFGHGLSYTTFELSAPTWDGDAVQRAPDEHRIRTRRGNGAVLRARRRGDGGAAAAGAEGVREGLARPGRVARRHAPARRARVLVLGHHRARVDGGAGRVRAAHRHVVARDRAPPDDRTDLMTRPTLSVGLANFGETFPPGEWKRFVDLGRAAEDAGIDRVVVVDHVVMGPHTENYVWGKFPVPPDAPWLEPLTMLTAIAAVTTRVRLATGILIAPLRPAALLAKQVATLDQISGGRVDLGVGTGWQREEYDAQNLDFDERGQLLDDTLAACRVLWRDTPADAGHADAVVPRHLLRAQAGAGGRSADLGRGHVARPQPRAPRRVRRRAGSRSWVRPRTASRPAPAGSATRSPRPGRDPDGLQVQAPIRMAKNADGEFDIAASMASVPDLVAGGATDIIVTLRAFAPEVASVPAVLMRLREEFDAVTG